MNHQAGVGKKVMNGYSRITAFVALLVFAALGSAHEAAAQSADVEAIKDVIQSAYIDGLQSNGSRDDIRAGFHPSFVMKVYREGEIPNVAIEDWIGRLPPEGQGPDHTVTAEFPEVHVAGMAAVAAVRVMHDGDLVFTDFMSLYRFPEGWRIVAKIFNNET